MKLTCTFQTDTFNVFEILLLYIKSYNTIQIHTKNCLPNKMLKTENNV